MLPPGHIAAGYLVAHEITKLVPYNLTPSQSKLLTLIGTLVAFSPDLDFFYAFAKIGKMRIDNTKVNHRKLFSHAPMLWFALAVVIFFASGSPFGKTLAIIIWLCSWAHFLLDSEWGIMWLWPFSRRLYPFSQKYYAWRYKIPNQTPPDEHFFQYWFDFAKIKSTEISTYLELVLIIIALFTALHK